MKYKIIDSHKFRDYILNLIKNGEKEKIRQYLPELRSNFENVDLGLINRVKKDPVRSLKNIMLSCNTIYFINAERGGLDHIKAHYMAEKYALEIENAKNRGELFNIHDEMALEYANKEIRNYKHDSISEKTKQYINNNFMNPELNIELISKELSLSKGHIMRVFKIDTKNTINSYIQKVRLEEAMKLLRFSNLSIIDVAYTVGFGSSQYFSNVFKKERGLTPLQYRKKVRYK